MLLNRSVLRCLASAALIVVLVGSSSQAIYLSGKAWLAQRLLYAAWRESETINTPRRPWPWADIHPVGLLQIPALGIEQVVLNDHSGESLAFGPGMAEANGTIMLAGHRDSHFAFLQELAVGDHINFQRSGEPTRVFRVNSTQVLDTRRQEQIIATDEVLLLVTCFPFDALTAGGPLRYVVVATKIP
ncbi:MAG: class GN sortase [Cellvibrionaceae bacterium]